MADRAEWEAARQSEAALAKNLKHVEQVSTVLKLREVPRLISDVPHSAFVSVGSAVREAKETLASGEETP